MGRYVKFANFKNRINDPGDNSQYYPFPNTIPIDANVNQWDTMLENTFRKAKTNYNGNTVIETSNFSLSFGSNVQYTATGLDHTRKDIVFVAVQTPGYNVISPGNIIDGYVNTYRWNISSNVLSNITQSNNWLGVNGGNTNFITNTRVGENDSYPITPFPEPVYTFSGNTNVYMDFLSVSGRDGNAFNLWNNFRFDMAANTLTYEQDRYQTGSQDIAKINQFDSGLCVVSEFFNISTTLGNGVVVPAMTSTEYSAAGSPLLYAGKLFVEHYNGNVYVIPGAGASKNYINDPANIDFSEKVFVEVEPSSNTQTEITITGHELTPATGSTAGDILYNIYEKACLGADGYFYLLESGAALSVYDLVNRTFIRRYRPDNADYPLSTTGGYSVTAIEGPDVGILGPDGYVHFFISGVQPLDPVPPLPATQHEFILSIDTNPLSPTYQQAELNFADEIGKSENDLNTTFMYVDDDVYRIKQKIGSVATTMEIDKISLTGQGNKNVRLNGPLRIFANGLR